MTRTTGGSQTTVARPSVFGQAHADLHPDGAKIISAVIPSAGARFETRVRKGGVWGPNVGSEVYDPSWAFDGLSFAGCRNNGVTGNDDGDAAEYGMLGVAVNRFPVAGWRAFDPYLSPDRTQMVWLDMPLDGGLHGGIRLNGTQWLVPPDPMVLNGPAEWLNNTHLLIHRLLMPAHDGALTVADLVAGFGFWSAWMIDTRPQAPVLTRLTGLAEGNLDYVTPDRTRLQAP